MHKRGLRRRAVSVCPSVCPSVRHVRGLCRKEYLQFFSPTGSHTILVFPYLTSWRYSDGEPPNWGVICRWDRQNHDSQRISGYRIGDCWTCEQQLRWFTVQFMAQTATHQWIFVYHNWPAWTTTTKRRERTELNCTQQ